jgi:hypothetical protein
MNIEKETNYLTDKNSRCGSIFSGEKSVLAVVVVRVYILKYMQTHIFVPCSEYDVDCHRIMTGGSHLASTAVDDILVLGIYVLLLKSLKSPEVDLVVTPNYRRVFAGRDRPKMTHSWDSRSQGL